MVLEWKRGAGTPSFSSFKCNCSSHRLAALLTPSFLLISGCHITPFPLNLPLFPLPLFSITSITPLSSPPHTTTTPHAFPHHHSPHHHSLCLPCSSPPHLTPGMPTCPHITISYCHYCFILTTTIPDLHPHSRPPHSSLTPFTQTHTHTFHPLPIIATHESSVTQALQCHKFTIKSRRRKVVWASYRHWPDSVISKHWWMIPLGDA